MKMIGLNYSDHDPLINRWFVVFNGVRVAQTFSSQENAELHLAWVAKLYKRRNPGKGRPKKNRAVFYEPTNQWKVYLNDKFICLMDDEDRAWDYVIENAK